MEKNEKLRRIYGLVLAVITVAAGIAVICVAADIYYSGRGGVIYTRDIVADRLQKLAIPLMLVVAAIVVGAVFPVIPAKVKPSKERAARLLERKMPLGGEGDKYIKAEKDYRAVKSDLFDLRLGVGVILLCCALAVLCYVVNAANFGGDVSADMLKLVKNVMPWVGVAFASLILETVYGGIYAARRADAVRSMIKNGNGVTVLPDGSAIEAAERRRAIAVWSVRGAVFVAAVTFIVLGILNGGARDVLIKAVNICQECIGLG